MIMVNFLIVFFIFINKAGNFFFFFLKKNNVEFHIGARQGVCVYI